MDQRTRREFEVALSFPGEERAFVEEVASYLAGHLGKERVLYDKFHEGRFAVLDLDVRLPELYRTSAELVVIVLCPDYAKKRWCRLEMRHIRQLIATDDQSRIMLLSRGDPGDLAPLGLTTGDGYLPADGKTPARVMEIILEELERRTQWKRAAAPEGVPAIALTLPELPAPREVEVTGRGWLVEPGLSGGLGYSGHIASLMELDGVSCVVAIGEPGIGKTTAMRQEFAAAKARTTAGDSHCVVGIDLRVYRDEKRFVEEVFASSWWRSWSTGQGCLALYLDSLDECRLGTPFVTDLFTREFERHRERLSSLRIRIASRTADLPRQISDTWCNDLFKSTGFVLVRVPLLESQEIHAMLAQKGANAAEVIASVRSLGADDLLRRPITLNMLARAFRRDPLPRTLIEIYRQGCGALADEWDPARTDERRRDSGSPSGQTMLVFDTHAAAMLVLSNRRFVEDYAAVPGEDSVLASTVAKGAELPDGFEIDRLRVVRECLRMALFSKPDPRTDQSEFSHRTYAEFLASQHPNRAALKSLLLTDQSPGARIVPQLAEVAAWLACQDREFREFVMRTQPQLLLRSDVVRSDDDSKEQVALAMLLAVEEGRIALSELRYLDGYANLACLRVAELLGRWVQDAARSLEARALACTVAGHARLPGIDGVVGDGLYAVLSSVTEDMRLRIAAASAIGTLGDVRMDPLRRLAHTNVEDHDDELKGYALGALFPQHLGAEQIFDYIVDPQNPSFFGAYASFLYELGQNVSSNMLLPGLAWCRNIQRRAGDFGVLVDLQDSIVRKAWCCTADPLVVSGLADLALTWSESYVSILPSARQGLLDSSDAVPPGPTVADEARRAVVLKVLCITTGGAEFWGRFVFSQRPLAIGGDAQWLLGVKDQLPAAAHGAWAELAETLFRAHGQDYFELVAMNYSQIHGDEDLRQSFSSVLEPWELNGDAAQHGRAELARMRQRQDRDESHRHEMNSRKLKEAPAVRVRRYLERAEQDPAAGWWQVWLQLKLTPDSTNFGNPLHTIVAAMPGWVEADPGIRQRLLAVACLALEVGSPVFDEWFGTTTIHYPAMAGYAAFALVRDQARSLYERISDAAWQKWSSTIVAVPVDGQSEHTLQEELVAEAYARCPENTLKTLGKLLAQESEKHEAVFSHRLLGKQWDERIRAFFQELVNTANLKPRAVATITELLVERGERETIEWALACVDPHNGHPPGQRVAFARALLAKAHAAAWRDLQPILENDHDFAREVFQELAHSAPGQRSWPDDVDVSRDGGMLRLLLKVFPFGSDVRPEGMHVVGPKEGAQELRDSLLRRVTGLGTHEAVDLLLELATEHPELKWLRERALETRSVADRTSWRPKSPDEVANMLAGRRGA